MKLICKSKLLKYASLFLILSGFNLVASKLNANQNTFIENKGQIINQNFESNSDVLFMYTGKGIKIQLRKSGYSYELFKIKNLPELNAKTKLSERPELLSNTLINTHRVDINFMNANPLFQIVKEGKQDLLLNYVVCGKEVPGINSYSKIIYKNITQFFITHPCRKNKR